MKNFLKQYWIFLIVWFLFSTACLLLFAKSFAGTEPILQYWFPSDIPIKSSVLRIFAYLYILCIKPVIYFIPAILFLALIFKKEKNKEKRTLWTGFSFPILLVAYILFIILATLISQGTMPDKGFLLKQYKTISSIFVLFAWHFPTALISALIIPKKYFQEKWTITKGILWISGINAIIAIAIFLFAL